MPSCVECEALGKERPSVEAKVTAQTVDLTRYGGPEAAPATAFLTTPWSSKRLEFSALNSLDARFDITAQAFAQDSSAARARGTALRRTADARHILSTLLTPHRQALITLSRNNGAQAPQRTCEPS